MSASAAPPGARAVLDKVREATAALFAARDLLADLASVDFNMVQIPANLTMRQAQARYARAVLALEDGNKTRAAKRLCISRRWVYHLEDEAPDEDPAEAAPLPNDPIPGDRP